MKQVSRIDTTYPNVYSHYDMLVSKEVDTQVWIATGWNVGQVVDVQFLTSIARMMRKLI